MERRKKEEKPVLAICYDFDKTLSPDDMQAQGFIQEVYDGDVKSFWDESGTLAKEHEMDTNLAYMYKMMREARGRKLFTKTTLREYGARVALFPGVEEWFERIRQYGAEHGVIVEHYIISAGLKEMIEGTTIANEFERIYASSFFFDEDGVAIWPAQTINFTNKTQFLFRIEKGVLDVNDEKVNESVSPEDVRVPFRNMVYIGDSATDIPCMKLVNVNGGHSIGVFNNETLDKERVYKMLQENRIKYFVPADYTDGSKLDSLIKAIVVHTAAAEILEVACLECKREQCEMEAKRGKDKEKRIDLILSLNDSRSFETTHAIMKELCVVKGWTEDEIEMLLDIAIKNHPVRYLLNDLDVKMFYRGIIKALGKKTDKTEKVESYFDEE